MRVRTPRAGYTVDKAKEQDHARQRQQSQPEPGGAMASAFARLRR